MKNMLLILLILCVGNFSALSQEIKVENHPNIMIVGSEVETIYLHPSLFTLWFFNKKPTRVHYGQAVSCIVDGKPLVVSAPHVTNTKGWAHPLPLSEFIGAWQNSKDGREICFANLKDFSIFGLAEKPIQAAEPVTGPATILSVDYNAAIMGIEKVEIPGILEIITEQEHIDAFRNFFEQVAPQSAISERFSKRAPTKSFICMEVDRKFQTVVQGASGAMFWQNGKPVGVFVARTNVDGSPPLLIGEPLIESARETIPSLK